jgi:hypothetical protein
MRDATLDRRHLWRHLCQCVLAEQAARNELARAEFWIIPRGRIERAAKRLMVEGIRLDAAIDALDETLTETRRSA